MNIQHKLGAALASVSLALLAACGGGGGGGTADTGTLGLSLTDAPSCGYDHVNVAIQKIRVNQSSTASDTDAGWTDLAFSTPKRVDLLTLTNGVLTSLGQIPLQVGHYTQMRLVLAANDSTNPLLNSVMPTGGSEVALDTPSGVQTGLKMNVDINIAANQLADFVLDFNACKSVVSAGNSGKYQLKPVVAVTPNFISGVSGYVDASLANGNTLVSVQQGGMVVKATAPDATGKFLLQPVAPGSYDLVVTAPGRASEVVTGLTVTASTVTLLNASATPLTLAASLSGTAAGTVTTTTTPIDASVRALQTLANGDKVEIIGRAVDATTGTYSYALPVSATMVAAFVAPQGTLSFSADAATAAKFGLEASSAGAVKTAGPLTLTAGGATTTNFSFP
ncbi:DUF4382 domain-containing protein [Roseateles saccharophilus]|uniref:Carboxypeptidase family protein n=1 Tax=Roseateles saccharophilus TaxID=304 RepID=A0A4R3VBN5_ROSSA|nr:DUF4382 domain-containing protein [Roseateles saccharophilus]MDG0831776.1 DUF4382 domain-containing protein [Roseateles saccharophilus]TCV01203.1 carboxypeptidase family protein [Roseateles saccharophilus]